MNQRNLKYFIEVYKCQNINKAAQNLLISPQGLSKTILQLENELGESLFERTPKKLIPTEAGLQLLRHAETIVSEFEIIENKRFLYSNTKKILKIVSSSYVLRYLTVDFIKQFHILHPHILLNITESTDEQVMKQLENHEAELAILPSPIDGEKFNINYLFSSNFCLVINKNHPLAQKQTIDLTDLHNEFLAVRGHGFSSFQSHENKMIQQGIHNINILETTSYYIIHRMADADLAIGISLDFVANEDVCPHTVIRPFSDNSMVKTMYLVENKNNILSEEASIFKQFLLEWLKPKKE